MNAPQAERSHQSESLLSRKTEHSDQQSVVRRCFYDDSAGAELLRPFLEAQLSARYFRTHVSVCLPAGLPPTDALKSFSTVSVPPSADIVLFDVPKGFPFIFTTHEV